MRFLCVLVRLVIGMASGARAEMWGGPYLEGTLGQINLGYAFDQQASGSVIPAVNYSSSEMSYAARVAFGYGWQSGQFGKAIELGYTLRDINNGAYAIIRRVPVKYDVHVPGGFDLTAKLGYQLSDRVMLSVLGGVAQSQVSVTGTVLHNNVVIEDSTSDAYGLRFGLGLDYEVKENVMLTTSLVQTRTSLDIDETVMLGSTQARARRSIDGTLNEIFVGVRINLR